MTFAELLKVKDDAVAKREEAASALHQAEQAVESAASEHGSAVKAHDYATKLKDDAHRAIHDYLADRGEHYLIDNSGTLTLFRATAIDPGWVAVHPIPGLDPTKKAK